MGPACPDPDTLRSLLAGLIPGPLADDLEAHLETCRACLGVARTLPVEDALLVAAGRGPAGPAAVAEGERLVVEHLLLRARSLFGSGPGGDDAESDLDDWLARVGGQASRGEFGRVGPYRLLGLLGAGGMGVVLRAEDDRLGRPVAVKVMRPRLAERPDARERFLREARALAAVSHDHVVPVYEVGEEGGVPYFVMPRLRGMTLADWLRHNPPPPTAVAVRWGRQLAEGLAAAHACGLVHRDVKPGNVWLETEAAPDAGAAGEPAGPTGRVKLLDFGLVRNEQAAGTATREGLIVGTPEYLSPEQARGEPVDARGDLFSLGCVLYELCTGVSPFRRPTVLATLSALATDTPRRVRERRPDAPPAFDDLVLRLLARRPQDRPASAAEVAGLLLDLEAGARHGPSHRRARRALLGGLLVTGATMATAGLIGWSFIPAVRDGPPAEPRIAPGSGSPSPSPGSPGPTPVRLAGHAGPVNALAFLPGSRTLWSGSADGTVRRWDTKEKREVGKPIPVPKGCTGLALTRDGRTVAACGLDGFVRLFDAVTGKATLYLETPGPLHGVAFDRTGEMVCAATDQGVIWCAMLAKTCHWQHPATNRKVRWVGVSPDGEWLGAGTDTGMLWFCSLRDEAFTESLTSKGLLRSGAFSPDRTRLATVTLGSEYVSVWDIPTKKQAAHYRLHLGSATAVAWSPRGRLVASGGASGVVAVWEAQTGRVVGTLRTHTPALDGVSVPSLAFASNGTLASGGADGVVALWDVSSLAEPAAGTPAGG